MYGEIKHLIRHGSIYAVGIVISRIITIVMIPIYTKCLTPAEYGVLELLGLTTDLMSTSIGMGMTAAVGRFYFKYEDNADRHAVISTSLLGVVTVMAITALSCILFSEGFSNLLFSTAEYASSFRVMFLTMFLSSAIEIPLIFLRVKQRSVAFVIINLVKLVLQLGLNIYFLVYLKMGILGVLYSGLIGTAIVAGYLAYTAFRETGIRFDFGIYKEMLRFGAPLIMAELSVFGLSYADHYLLNYLGDLTIVGLYALAYKFGMMVASLFTAPFRSIWTTRMFEIAKQEDGHKVYARVTTYFLMGSLTISLGMSCIAKDALRVMADASYWSAYHIVPLIAVSHVAVGLISVAGVGLLIQHKTKLIAFSTTAALIVNLIMCFALIPVWGAVGAALATLVSFIVRLAIDTYNSQKLFHVSYDWRRLGQTLALYLLLTLLALYVQVENVVLSILANGAIIVAFPLLLLALGVLLPEERSFIIALLLKPFKKTQPAD